MIKKYYDKNNNNGSLSSTIIRDNLFPHLSDESKVNAAHQIQVILGRSYSR